MVSNEKNTKKNRKNILPFPADRGAGKYLHAGEKTAVQDADKLSL